MATYIRLTDYKSSDEKEQEFFNPKNRYEAKQEDFSKIPGSPIAYWLKSNTFNLYSNVKLLEDIAKIKTGMTTANNDLFVRQWQEVDYNKTSFLCSNANDALLNKAKWFPYNKGGGFRKWYGLNENVINWENNGLSIKNNFDTNGKKKASVRAEEYYFKESISYSSVTSASFSSRISLKGFLFDSGGSSIFCNDIIYTQSILGSKIPDYFLSIYNI